MTPENIFDPGPGGVVTPEIYFGPDPGRVKPESTPFDPDPERPWRLSIVIKFIKTKKDWWVRRRV